MKKAAFILAVCAILCFTACGNSVTTNTETDNTADSGYITPPPEIPSPEETDTSGDDTQGSTAPNTAKPDETDDADDDVIDAAPTDTATQEPTNTPSPATNTPAPPTASITSAPTISATPTPTESTSPVPVPKPEPSPEPVQTKYKDGTHRGSAWGYESNIVVDVTISADAITSVKLVEHADDDIYVQDAVLLIPDVIKTQSADVDAVSGATATSDGIKNAIKAALKKAEN